MTYLLLQERSPFIKHVLPDTLDVNFLSANKICLHMLQELHGVVILTRLLTYLR